MLAPASPNLGRGSRTKAKHQYREQVQLLGSAKYVRPCSVLGRSGDTPAACTTIQGQNHEGLYQSTTICLNHILCHIAVMKLPKVASLVPLEGSMPLRDTMYHSDQLGFSLFSFAFLLGLFL